MFYRILRCEKVDICARLEWWKMGLVCKIEILMQVDQNWNANWSKSNSIFVFWFRFERNTKMGKREIEIEAKLNKMN